MGNTTQQAQERIAEVATRARKFAKASDKCSTQQKGHSLVKTGHRQE